MLTPVNPIGQTIPPGMSQAMLVKGNLLFLSGHVSVGPAGVVGADVETQLVQTFENIAGTLKAAGADFSSIAQLTTYIVNYHTGLLPVFRSVRDRFINLKRPPASTLIGVAALALPGLLVEIDAIAVVA
ncbi:MAG TPA: Rid family hydrolase [Bauldia sp.]